MPLLSQLASSLCSCKQGQFTAQSSPSLEAVPEAPVAAAPVVTIIIRLAQAASAQGQGTLVQVQQRGCLVSQVGCSGLHLQPGRPCQAASSGLCEDLHGTSQHTHAATMLLNEADLNAATEPGWRPAAQLHFTQHDQLSTALYCLSHDPKPACCCGGRSAPDQRQALTEVCPSEHVEAM